MKRAFVGLFCFVPAGIALLADPEVAISLLAERTRAVQDSFFVYQDADSAFNHGFPSGVFGQPFKVHLEVACLDDPSSPTGCSSDPDLLDRGRKNVLRIQFDPLGPGQFAGVNVEEPEDWGANPRGVGYDLRGARRLQLDMRSPAGMRLQVGLGGRTWPFLDVGPAWRSFSFELDQLEDVDLANVHLLFTVATNDLNAPGGGTVLLDDVRLIPTPATQAAVAGFPLGTETFGVLPRAQAASGRVPFPPDQYLRNLATTYESALAILILLDRGRPDDLALARRLADALHRALRSDNAGDSLPAAPDLSRGLHNGYEGGDLLLQNGQGPGAGQAGQIRLAGFSAADNSCGASHFCLVLDGATGGNNAFAILALLAAYEHFGVPAYLDDARTLARWIFQQLGDRSEAGFGGYFLGYPDQGLPKLLIRSKSTENVADIFAAYSRLAGVEARLGRTAEAADWTAKANAAGDFVMSMFDSASGCFFGGTVPVGTQPGLGVRPDGARRGDDIVNTALFIDSNTFSTLALAASPRYRSSIDWRRPLDCALSRFARQLDSSGQSAAGFSIDEETPAGPEGVAWEFTGQAVALARFVDDLYGETQHQESADFYLAELRRAQAGAPFGDGNGWVAASLEGIESLPPLEHCLSTSFQCIPQRVGLAATAWGIFAERNLNPLGFRVASTCVPSDTTMCLDGNRFQVEITWKVAGKEGAARVVPVGSGDSGLFYFFSPQNWEALVKVLNGCSINQRYWVFAAATTDVEYRMTVTDLATGLQKIYFNPPNTAAAAITDSQAFASCP